MITNNGTHLEVCKLFEVSGYLSICDAFLVDQQVCPVCVCLLATLFSVSWKQFPFPTLSIFVCKMS